MSTDLRLGRCETRPIRIAFLVQEGENSHLALDGIFADCYRRWGGRFSLIIPCVENSIPEPYWPWLIAYDPDIIYSYFHMGGDDVLRIHKRIAPSIYHEHRETERLDVHGFKPEYGIAPLSSLSTIFRRSRQQDYRSTVGPYSLIDAWHTEDQSRFLADNFGTYHRSYGTSQFPSDARAAAHLLTIISPEIKSDRQYGVPQDLFSVPSEMEAFKEFANRRTSSLAIASMDFAAKLDVHHGGWSDSFNLVIGDSLLDRILFWNSRLLLPNWIGAHLGAFRIDPEMLSDEHFLTTLIDLINHRNYVNSGTGGQYQLTIRSASIAAVDLVTIAERLKAGRCWSMTRTHFVQDISIMTPTPEELEQSSPSSPVGPLFSAMSRLNEFSWATPLAIPVVSPPDHLADAPPRQAFASGAWASDYLLDHSEPKPRFSSGNLWMLPRRWRMAGAFDVKFSAAIRDINCPQRSTRAGELTLFESLERRVRSISVPSGPDAIRYALTEDGRWARQPGYKGPPLLKSPVDWMEPSNEARYLNGVVGMADDLDRATQFLLHPFMQGVLADLGGTAKPQADSLRQTIEKLKGMSSNSVPFDINEEAERTALASLIVRAASSLKSPFRHIRHEALVQRWQSHREAFWAQTGVPEGADDKVDWNSREQESLDDCLIAMRKRQMMFQGHEWICADCHHRNWVDMAELSPVLLCKICREATNAPITFGWLFRPNNFLIEALRDHSTLSLLWTLNAVRNRGRNSFIYAGPSSLWYEDRDRGPEAEVDLLLVLDQSTIVVEVKSSWNSVRSRHIDELGEMAKRLRPDIALLAVMDKGQRHGPRLSKLHEELEALEIKLEVMTLDTHPLEDCPYLK